MSNKSATNRTQISSPVYGGGAAEGRGGGKISAPPSVSLRSTPPPQAVEENVGALLPQRFADWFAGRGWRIRAHQSALIAHAAREESVLLVAPTGGGKTLAGFLPSLIELSRLPQRRARTLHTLYISPLKALAVDVGRNLEAPVADMGLAVKVESRTGDTPHSRRQASVTHHRIFC